MICKGTEILYANAQLFRRLIVKKNAVYTSHERSGMTRLDMNNDRGPSDIEMKSGRVNRAVTMN